MALRVVGERKLVEERAVVEAMSQDSSARVRTAAARTLTRLER